MEFRQMSMRYNKFVMDIDNKVAPELVAKLQEIGKKLEVLDYKFKKNLKFDPETKMWKVSMDNKVDADLQKEMNDVAKELGETSGLLEDPKYKAELDAIAAKMKALDAKFKANLKVTK